MTRIYDLDLTACEREPIHIPGSIQPHGLLLIADLQSQRIVAGAGDVEERLASSWLDQSLSDVLAQDVAAQLATLPAGATSWLLEQTVRGRHECFDAMAHRQDHLLIVELDPSNPQPTNAALLLTGLDGFARNLALAPDVATTCERAAVAFRALTGFDRVMIYRFGDEEAGQVLAEDCRPGLDSFLHHHFPGSDIPRQARALYVRNLARSIPNVNYTPAPIRPAAHQNLDLSDVQLRSVSPVHLQYLRNMNVTASASFSIVCDGVLWGLVASHHETPRHVHRDTIIAGTTLANALARQLMAKERTLAYEKRLRLRLSVDKHVLQLSCDGSAQLAFQKLSEPLRELLHADGFAYVTEEQVDLYGVGPDPADIRQLVEWAVARSPDQPLVTRCLSEIYPPASGWPQKASGVLMMQLSHEEGALLWFRVEEPETVRWAGNPHKPVSEKFDRPLTPRKSFKTWTETVRGRSHHWSPEEIEAARRLIRSFGDAQINRRIRRLNRELQDALAERDSLLEQKDLLMKEVDHRVQNSLQIVSSYLAVQARDAGPGIVADHLRRAGGRLSAVAQVHRRLYHADEQESIELGHYLHELLDDLLDALGDEWRPYVVRNVAQARIAARRAMSVGLVMTELILNASKYAYGGLPGPITIRLEQYAECLRLTVADEGCGRQRESASTSGFGSRMIAATAAGLQGALEYEDSPAGLSVILIIPAAP